MPPSPLSGPTKPKSVTKRYHMSSINPRTFGGTSRTRGPSCRSSQNQVYGVLLFGVRKIDRAFIIVSKIGTVVLAGPTSSIPLRFATWLTGASPSR